MRKIVEQRRHLVGRADVVGRILHPQPLVVHHVGARLDADVHVLVLVVGLADVMGVVGDQQRHAGIPVQPNQAVVDPGQLLNVFVPLQLQEVVLAEQLAVPADHLLGVLVIAVGQKGRHLGGGAPGETDETLPVADLSVPCRCAGGNGNPLSGRGLPVAAGCDTRRLSLAISTRWLAVRSLGVRSCRLPWAT